MTWAEVRQEAGRRMRADLVRLLMARGMNDDQIAVMCDFTDRTGEEMRRNYEASKETA